MTRLPVRALGWGALASGALLTLAWLGSRWIPQGLPTGSMDAPRLEAGAFLWAFTVLGGLAVAAGSHSVATLLARRGARVAAWQRSWLDSSDRRFAFAAALVGAALALGWQRLVLRGAPLFDDESAYRMSAWMLAHGQLTMALPSDPELWRRAQLVADDGRYYTQYFLGWPALWAPFVRLGMPSLANPLFHALTVPAVLAVLTRVVRPGLARVGALLFACAPLYAIGAATGLSHTASTMLLAWATLCFLRAAEPDRRHRHDLLLGLLLAAAFWVRPVAAVGFGLPLALGWGWARARAPGRLVALLSFLLPVVPLALLFLWTNNALTGDPFKTGYDRLAEIALGTQARWMPADLQFYLAGGDVPQLSRLPSAPLRAAWAWVRLDRDLLGWPTLTPLVLLARDRRALWLLLSWFATHFLNNDNGVDTFGPHHFIEAGLPMLALAVSGLERLDDPRWPGRAAAVAAVGSLVALVVMMPLRVEALAHIASVAGAPERAVAHAGLENVVIFSQRPFAPGWCSLPHSHFLLSHPAPDAGPDASVLWVNHLDTASDRALLARDLPGRTGWIQAWYLDCTVTLIPLASALADLAPPASDRGGPENLNCPAPWLCRTAVSRWRDTTGSR